MKLALLSMPGGSPFSPPLSILSLGSYLRENGVDVALIDASIDYFHYSLNPEHLWDSYRRLPSIIKRKPGYGSDLAADFDRLHGFSRKIWTPDGFEIGGPDRFEETVRLIGRARDLIDLPFHPISISAGLRAVPGDWRTLSWSVNRRWDGSSLVYSRRHPLIRYCSEVLIPRLRSIGPDLVGVSISYSEQAHRSYVVIEEIRKRLGVPIVVGGSYFHELFEGRPAVISGEEGRFARIAPLLHPFGILGEGEKPLLELCRCVAQGRPADGIPGLFRQEGDRVLLQREEDPLSTDDLPMIDLKLLGGGNKYLSPLKIAPLMTSRGCYWNKCAFCDHANTIQGRWRELKASKVIENIRQYRDAHNVEYVLFCDECTSPRMLEQLSRRLRNEPRRLFFGTMARFDKKLASLIEPLAVAGCRSLSFGLESGCQRVVDLMGKGYRLIDASSIIRQCARQGILVELFVMFGFPTERLSEAVETVEFIESNHREIDVLRINPWYWKADSPIGRHPERYGLESAKPGGFGFGAGSDAGRVSGGLARELAKSLTENPVLRNKVIKSTSSELQQEEFHVIASFCKGKMRLHVDVEEEMSPSSERVAYEEIF